MPRLILGTANFSGNYGQFLSKNFNTKKVNRIIQAAQHKGLVHFDTAKSYPNAEKFLGQFLDQTKQVQVDTKISLKYCISVDSIIEAVKESLSLLKIPKLETLYLHNPSLLLGEKSKMIIKAFDLVIEAGLAQNVGVSSYDYNDILDCKQKYSNLSRFQINENICDRKLFYSEELNALANSGNKIYIRTIFLQGLLLTEPKRLSGQFKSISKQIHQLNEFACRNGTTVAQLCLAYAKSIRWADGIVVGVDSINQLNEIIYSNFELPNEWQNDISIIPSSISDPRNWN